VSWPVVELSEVCSRVSVGHVGKTSEYYTDETGIPFLRTQNVSKTGLNMSDVLYVTHEFHEKLKKSQLFPGDVVLSRVISSQINCAVIPNGFGVANCANIILVRPDAAKLDSEFLNYYLKSEIAQRNLMKRQVGSAQSVVNTSVLKSWEIPLPPLNEQKRIAAILDKADAIRRKRQQAINLADDFLRSVFLDMFGDPVTNPKGWDVGKFFDISMLNPKAEKYDDELPVSFVPMPSVSEKSHILDPSDIRDYSAVKKGFTAFIENDVLFAKITPCMENGKAAIATNLKNGIGFGSTEFHVFRPQNMDYAPFIYSLLHLPLFRKIAANNFSGAVGHKRVPKDFLSSFKLILPPEHLVIKFKNIFETVNESKSKFDSNVEDGEQLFNSLSQKAFAGEL
jgi:type I restriction enzyme S subunit